MPSPNPLINPGSPPRTPDPAPPDDTSSFLKRIARWWLTDARIRGYVRHAGAWLATFLATHHLLGSDQSSIDLVVGCVGNIAIVAWSWYAEHKGTTQERVAGLIRHVLTIAMGIVVFKGYITNDNAEQIIALVLGVIASFGASAAGGEKKTLVEKIDTATDAAFVAEAAAAEAVVAVATAPQVEVDAAAKEMKEKEIPKAKPVDE